MSAAPPGALHELALALRRACGVVFADAEARPLQAGAAAAAAALGVDPATFAARVRAGDPAAVRALVECSVVGETYFGRHPEQLEALRAHLRALPRGRPVRVWCAGCATGEEAWTVAMMLAEDGRGGAAHVLATDVSRRALEVARLGRYGPWSLRGLGAPARARWLVEDGAGFTVAPELRPLVHFSAHNLVAEPPPATGLDVVLCRNVLIYFDRPTADVVVRRLFEAVEAGGVVVLAPAEVPLAEPLGLERLDHRGGALWRKRSVDGAAARRGVAPRTAAARAPSAAAAAAPPAVTPPPSPAAPGGRPAPEREPLAGALAEATAAAAAGRWAEAEERAREAGERSLAPEPFLLAAAAAEARADPAAAVRWLGRALFLDPGLVVARASLVPLLERLGRSREAARARREALEALAGVADDELLPGVEPVAAGALRSALGDPRFAGGVE